VKVDEIYNARIVDLALQIDENLIIADTHFGYEEALIQHGVLIPKFQYKRITDRMKKIFEIADSYCKIRKVIINGDLKHEFGRKSRQEYEEIPLFINFLKNYVNEIVLVRGNHDNFIAGTLREFGVEFCENFSVKNFFITHGHKIQEIDKDKVIIIAHEHPCIGLRTSERIEKIKCFLKGKFKNNPLIVMPALNPITEGTDILQEKLLSPFLSEIDLEDFEVIGVENFETFYFGKVKTLLNINF